MSQEALPPTYEELRIRHTSFESAQQSEKKFSDTFIDSVIEEQSGGTALPFTVGSERVGLKGYLDKVAATADDQEIIDDPEAIAAVYLQTSEMLRRNLKLKVAPGTPATRVSELATAKQGYLEDLKDQALQTADQLVDWAATGDPRTAPRPGEGLGYYGFAVQDGAKQVDLLDQGTKLADCHPNIKIQRQGGGNFIFAYSDSRVSQRMSGQKDILTERIYLNPSCMETPEIFEKILSAANQSGISLELKMLQRAEELGAAHIMKSRDRADGSALRGDGIVMYVGAEQADEVLGMVLAIAQDQPEAFTDRQTSRIPHPVADGVAIGSEPPQRPGADPESLTSQRCRILSTIGQKVAASGKTGQEARDAFRRGIIAVSEANGVDGHNIAFNAA